MTDKASSSGELADEIYERQGFGHTTGAGERPALIIVDFVNGFADPAAFGGGNINAAILETQELLAFARKMNWPIVFTRVVFADDASDANVFARKVPSILALTEHSFNSAIVAELAPLPNEFILRKRLPSAFAGTDLAAWLAARRVDTVIVAGCTTSGCVRSTVVDAMGNGFLTIVAEGCVGDRALGPHSANMFDMAQKYADLMDFESIKATYGVTDKHNSGE